ncbi:hypothetical protein Asi02nite_65670 [Asanoa siamensis]|uniref:Uncharacterized protein n=1 Tax=Asanoa siamensis TaxID=926357 RepID=A0ABQ4D0I3_9ACTN|nr:hypothetical protein Asi02nite_65670 [Asanoa siamensis]
MSPHREETAMGAHDDPTVTDPHLYKLIFENGSVRILEYRDGPADRTHVHRHPDSDAPRRQHCRLPATLLEGPIGDPSRCKRCPSHAVKPS